MRFGGYPRFAEPAGQQLSRHVDGEQVDDQRPGALGGGQAGELVAAGHQDQAGQCAGKQGADLFGVAGVVQQDQHPLAGQFAAVPCGLGVRAGRDVLRWHAERFQEHPDGAVRSARRTGGGEAVQVDVQLPVRELCRHPVGEVDGEGGLAHAGGSGQRGYHHGRGPVAVCGEQIVEPLEFLAAAGEAVNVARELGRHGRRLRGRVFGCGRDALQDRPVQVLEFGARVGAQFVGQPATGRGVEVDSFRAAPGGVQRPHEHRRQGLHERVVDHRVGQRVDDRARVAGADLGVRPRDECVDVLLPPRVAHPGRPRPGDPGQRLSAPEPERLTQDGQAPAVDVPGRPGLPGQPAEPVQVDPVGVEVEQVAP